jgi:hypothetical protein
MTTGTAAGAPHPTRTKVRHAIVSYIEGFNNAARRHSALG